MVCARLESERWERSSAITSRNRERFEYRCDRQQGFEPACLLNANLKTKTITTRPRYWIIREWSIQSLRIEFGTDRTEDRSVNHKVKQETVIIIITFCYSFFINGILNLIIAWFQCFLLRSLSFQYLRNFQSDIALVFFVYRHVENA